MHVYLLNHLYLFAVNLVKHVAIGCILFVGNLHVIAKIILQVDKKNPETRWYEVVLVFCPYLSTNQIRMLTLVIDNSIGPFQILIQGICSLSFNPNHNQKKHLGVFLPIINCRPQIHIVTFLKRTSF